MRALVVMGMMGMVLGLSTQPAAACSCGPAKAPTVDFTGVAVEDLGYSETDSNTGPGKTRAWLLDVTDARLGVDEEQVRISMVVGDVPNADGSVAGNGCGLNDNLVLGESYDVTSAGLEDMDTCGSRVDGPRAEVPVRAEEDDGRLRDLLVIFGGGVVLLLLVGLLVVRTGRASGPR